jgi:hypothetical protein
MNIANNVNFNNWEARNILLHQLAADPTGIEAKFYYNTVSKKFRFYNGTTWGDIGSSGTGDVVGPASSVDSEIVLFDGTTGKLIKRASVTGILKGTAGVLSAATAGTDYTTASSVESFTNKTFNANGAGNSLSNVEVADFAASAIVTAAETIAANNNDTTIPTSAAVKAYADSILAANDAFTFEGAIDASTNPNYPAADAGHVYKISVAGKIGGASGPDVQIGDTLYATVDGSASGNHATVGSNWVIVQANIDRATDTTLGLAEYATLAEAEAKSLTTVALTPASVANFPIKKTFTIGDTTTTAFALTHNLNTLDVLVSIRKVSTGEQWLTDVTANSVNQVTITFGSAPSTNEFVVTVIG